MVTNLTIITRIVRITSARNQSTCDLSRLSDDDLLRGLSRLATVGLDGLNHIHIFEDSAEHYMLTVEPGGLDGGDKELRSLSVGPSVGHAQEPRLTCLTLKFSSLNLPP